MNNQLSVRSEPIPWNAPFETIADDDEVYRLIDSNADNEVAAKIKDVIDINWKIIIDHLKCGPDFDGYNFILGITQPMLSPEINYSSKEVVQELRTELVCMLMMAVTSETKISPPYCYALCLDPMSRRFTEIVDTEDFGDDNDVLH